MTTRRQFLSGTVLTTVGLLTATRLSRALGETPGAIQAFKGDAVFDRILKKAQAEKWSTLPIGECMGKIAMELNETPYVGFTLELSPDQEICSVNLDGLDCVTFFEDTLDFARMLKKGGSTKDDLLKEVTFTRYRDGKLGDFTSRLHYTTDWYVNNEKKNVVKILTPDLPGAAPFEQKVGIMSAKPKQYKQLAAHPEMVEKMKSIEETINGYALKYIPKDKVASVESKLQTGDLVGMCTNEAGTDIAHTGLVMVDAKGVPHFMDASSLKKKMKVTLEEPAISVSANSSKHWTGCMFARPLEPTVGA